MKQGRSKVKTVGEYYLSTVNNSLHINSINIYIIFGFDIKEFAQ